MKKLLLVVLSAILILSVPASLVAFRPGEWMNYSAVKTADALIHTGGGYVYGIIVATDGTNDVTVKTYDNTSAAGTKLHPDMVCTTSSSNRMCVLGFSPPVPYSTGVYVDVTLAAGAVAYTVYYRKK
jgi:hypothetical protein